ncbi:CynX/NimT family MFS transporter [Egibacter rhizosphaerae]|uniref:MFS transporter n=1 Tax=Egibacter rhizosphaerae TaxID=1670831 RepID=UPI0013F17B9F|nr:MFS transporter [Egibacter rhizosphaerae]
MSGRTSGVALAVALLAGALALRPSVVGVGPLLEAIAADLTASRGAVGLLATIPVFCMGLFAPLAAPLSARLGARHAIALGLLLIAVAGVVRAVAPSLPWILALTVLVGAGIGLAQGSLPAVVKRYAADRPATATGTYVAGIQIGAAAATALAAPVATVAGGWRGTLAVLGVATAVLAVAWLAVAPRERIRGEAAAALPVREPRAWLLVAIFGLQSAPFYGVNAWMPAYYVEQGWTPAAAGGLLGVVNLAGLAGALTVPRLADRYHARRGPLIVAAAVLGAALLASLAWPAGGWAWAVFIGVALGSLFSLTLTLPLDTSPDPRAAAATTGLVIGVGYLIAASAPATLGLVRDLTGTHVATLWTLFGVCVLLGLLCLPLSRERLRPTASMGA